MVLKKKKVFSHRQHFLDSSIDECQSVVNISTKPCSSFHILPPTDVKAGKQS